MKNYLYLPLICLLLAACGGGDDPDSPSVNTAPTLPVLRAPADNKLCLDNNVQFQWNGSTDEQKDLITYQIQIAKDNAFSQIVQTLEKNDFSTDFLSLEKNTAYYWRVKATDNKGLSSAYTATFKFYTSGEAVVNHVPFSPTLVKPLLNSSLTDAKVDLTWAASDVDTKDVLSYDVYFGTANPPTEKIGNNISALTLNVSVEPTKQYFWKVVVKDNKGGEAIGQVWKFKTN